MWLSTMARPDLARTFPTDGFEVIPEQDGIEEETVPGLQGRKVLSSPIGRGVEISDTRSSPNSDLKVYIATQDSTKVDNEVAVSNPLKSIDAAGYSGK